MRIALGLEYDGSDYRGWQRQSNGPSVQSAAEEAISKVADHPVLLTCAGRTDAGVHAIGQVVHFDTDSIRDNRAWILGSNSNLPPTVTVLWALQVDDAFHARFKAEWRSYRYIILNRFTRASLHSRYATWWHRPLDAERMHAAAQALVGRHDFSAFRASECQAKTPIKTLHQLTITRSGEWIYLDVRADGFLHHMVRNFAGVLTLVGTGEQPPEWPQRVLESRDREQGGITAPPNGLYLTGVGYPPAFNIPVPAAPPAFG
ncbi:MAG TPA: tRNA pseudouridine(38-40) synthase TruA [Gammaproteobacteria bacterium]